MSHDKVDNKQAILGLQISMMFVLGLLFLFWLWPVEYIWPDFFSPFAWQQTSDSTLGSVGKFWPLFVYGSIMALVSCNNIKPRFMRDASDEEHLVLDSLTSVGAGVWEELGYRCILVMTAMIGLMFVNWAFSWLLFVIVVFAVLALARLLFSDVKEASFGILVGLAIFVIFFGWVFIKTWNIDEPLYWLYENIVFWFLSIVSFGQLDHILSYDHAGATPLFVMGLVSANAKFRDGHGYQGAFGMLNSWVIGFIFIHAMLFHGLWVAIIIHVIYDLEFAGVRYVGRLLK